MGQFSVESLHFKNGQVLQFSPGELTLVVGRNSAGKSTFLREIEACVSNHELSSKIISKALFCGSTKAELRERVISYFRVVEEGTLLYVPSKHGGSEFLIPSFDGGPDKLILGKASKAIVTLLNSEGRLSLTHDVDTIDIYLSKPRHPFHVFMAEPQKLNKVSSIVQQAFGVGLTINRIGDPIRGYVAAELSDDDRLSSDMSLPQRADLLMTQGDGLRSYVGIVGEIEAMSHPLVLIDEPEAFLHPPQAKRLGRTVVSSLGKDRQAFIATHDSNFLRGAISNLDKRLRVLRLERANNQFRVIDIGHADLKEAEALPALANSNLLDSLFYDQTVLCEADADCKLFETIATDEKRDRFWFSAGGKQQFIKIIKILVRFGVDWRAVFDPDVLLNWEILTELAKLKGIDLHRYRKPVASALRSLKPIDLAEVRAKAREALASSTSDEVAIKDAVRELGSRGASTPLKQHGLSAFPNGQEREILEKLLDELASVGILILRKGELERYVPTVGRHGPAWVNSVLLEKQKHATELADLARELQTATR